MFKQLYPYEHVAGVFVIDYEVLYKLGYRGIIFDLDNTLVHHGDDSTPEVDALFQELHGMGFKTILLSDNTEERVQRFLKNIESDYICDANKPDKKNFLKAVERLEIPKEAVVYIGDQIFTDIWGANKCGIPNILVDFIREPQEKNIGKKRKLEKVILKFYERNKTCQNRIGNILKERGR